MRRPISARARSVLVYEVPQEIASAVYNKQRSDELQFAQLASRGTPVAPVRSGRDGGMHPTFVAKLQPREVVDERGNVKLVVDRSSQGSIVAYSSPPPARPTSPVQRGRPSRPDCQRAVAAHIAAGTGRRAAGSRTQLHRKAWKFLPRRFRQTRTRSDLGGRSSEPGTKA